MPSVHTPQPTELFCQVNNLPVWETAPLRYEASVKVILFLVKCQCARNTPGQSNMKGGVTSTVRKTLVQKVHPASQVSKMLTRETLLQSAKGQSERHYPTHTYSPPTPELMTWVGCTESPPRWSCWGRRGPWGCCCLGEKPVAGEWGRLR